MKLGLGTSCVVFSVLLSACSTSEDNAATPEAPRDATPGETPGDAAPGDATSGDAAPGAVTVQRLNGGEPIITETLFAAAGVGEDGANINGPSVIRIPDWIPSERRADPAAVYYLYFAHHLGAYLRLAWAANITGPWSLHGTGAGVPAGSRGVLDLGTALAIPLSNGLSIVDHIASPDVHVDEGGQRIVMYFHGWAEHNGVRSADQKTFVATSDDGLDFTGRVEPVILGRSYFRVFPYGGSLYAFANRGDPYRARDDSMPWIPPTGFDFATDLWQARADNPWNLDLQAAGMSEILRHVTVTLDRDLLHVLYTRIGGSPEQILHSTIDLAANDFDNWDPSFPPDVVLAPELPWEGADLPLAPSVGGDAPENVRQLRDPFVFQDADGRFYLFYSGRGEDAIGVAELFFE